MTYIQDGADKAYAVITSGLFSYTDEQKQEIINEGTFHGINDFGFKEKDILFFAYKENGSVITVTQPIKLRDILSIRFEDLHLIHNEEDTDPATIVELHSGTLTDAGKEAWADVLDGEVCSISVGDYGLQMVMSKVKANRLDGFSWMLAGYCAANDYDKWVTQEPDDD